MWVLVLIVAAAIGYLIINKAIDQETKQNFSFLLKILSVIFGILFILGVIVTINNH